MPSRRPQPPLGGIRHADALGPPEISVVVPSHLRPLRLRWLLNALEEQSLAPDRWEAIVIHDDGDNQAERALSEHGFADKGRLRRIRLAPGSGSPARQRNTGWRAARAPLVAFTDDDCRREPEWLERLLAAAEEYPHAIVQGATRPDPYEADVIPFTPRARTIRVDPPGAFAQTCNILYPRAVLESVGGLDETLPAAAGEDTDLALRARALGVPYVGAPRAVVNHAVEAYSILGMIRMAWKWQHLPYVVRRHPQLRRQMPLGLFWRSSHAWALGGALAAVTLRRWLALLAFAPYVGALMPFAGRSPRRWLRRLVELPSRVLIDLAELIALVRGSVRYRTPFL